MLILKSFGILTTFSLKGVYIRYKIIEKQNIHNATNL